MLCSGCNRHRDFHDNRIVRPTSEMSKLTRSCIGLLSQRVDDVWCPWDKAALVAN